MVRLGITSSVFGGRPLGPWPPPWRQGSRAEGISALAIGFAPENSAAAADHSKLLASEWEGSSPLALNFRPDRDSPVATFGVPDTKRPYESKCYPGAPSLARAAAPTLVFTVTVFCSQDQSLHVSSMMPMPRSGIASFLMTIILIILREY